MKVASDIATSLFTSRDELIATFEGDAEFAFEIVATFISTAPSVLQEIQEAFESGDIAGGSRLAHALKGSVGYFGDRRTYKNALMIETITDADLPRVPVLLDTLEQDLSTLTSYLVVEFGADAEQREALGW